MANSFDFKLTRRSLLLSSCFLPVMRILGSPASAASEHPDYPVRPVPLAQVDVVDQFWTPRMEVNRNVSIWHCFDRQKSDPFSTPRLIECAAYMIAKRRP